MLGLHFLTVAGLEENHNVELWNITFGRLRDVDFISSVLVYKKKMDSHSIMCYVSPRSQHGSCAPSLNAPLPLRDLERNEEKKD